MPTDLETLTTQLTPPQVHIGTVSSYDGALTSHVYQSGLWYRKVRKMRRDPTISLARIIAIAPVMVAPWSVEKQKNAPDGAADLIARTFEPLRNHILSTGFLGMFDFGWQSYEKVWEIDENLQLTLSKLKPLLHDTTNILIDPQTGDYSGVKYRRVTGDYGYLTEDKSFLLSMDVEAGDLYGQSLMANVEGPYDKWEEAEHGANRYDRKMAGAHWIVYYPLGQSQIDSAGTKKSNYEIALNILKTLESSSGTVVPATLSAMVDDLNKDKVSGWKIDLLTDQGGQTNFIDRMKYLDALKVRAFNLPERAVLEGQFGTKAEAEAHADLAIICMEMRHQWLVQIVNTCIVNAMLFYNYGKGTANTVYLKPAPIVDTAMQFLRQLYLKIIDNPSISLIASEQTDLEALQDKLGVPIRPDDDFDAPGYVDPSSAIDANEYQEVA